MKARGAEGGGGGGGKMRRKQPARKPGFFISPSVEGRNMIGSFVSICQQSSARTRQSTKVICA